MINYNTDPKKILVEYQIRKIFSSLDLGNCVNADLVKLFKIPMLSVLLLRTSYSNLNQHNM